MGIAVYKLNRKPPLTTFTPTLSASANCTKSGHYFKNADGQLVCSWRVDATGALGAGSALVFTLPDSLILDSARYHGTIAGDDSTSTKLELQGYLWNQGVNPQAIGASTLSTSTFKLHIINQGTMLDNSIGATDSLDFTLTLWVTGAGF